MNYFVGRGLVWLFGGTIGRLQGAKIQHLVPFGLNYFLHPVRTAFRPDKPYYHNSVGLSSLQQGAIRVLTYCTSHKFLISLSCFLLQLQRFFSRGHAKSAASSFQHICNSLPLVFQSVKSLSYGNVVT